MDWLRHVQTRRKEWSFLYFDCKQNRVPEGNFYRFGAELAGHVRAASIDPRHCMFSISDPSSTDLFRGLAENGFREASFGMDGLHNSQPRGASVALWAKTALEYKLPLIDLGRVPWDISTPLALWWPPTQYIVTARDGGAEFLKKVVYWKLGKKDSNGEDFESGCGRDHC